MLALAIQFQEMLRTGEVRDCADLARLAGVTRERISQIMKLARLAPDTQLEVLYFRPVAGVHFPIRERALRAISDRLGWEEQRKAWIKLKQTRSLTVIQQTCKNHVNTCQVTDAKDYKGVAAQGVFAFYSPVIF